MAEAEATGQLWTVDGPLKRRAKELRLRLAFCFRGLPFTGHGIRVMAIPTSGDYTIAFDGLIGTLRICSDGSFINSTGRGFREVPELLERVFAAIEMHSGSEKPNPEGNADRLKDKAIFLTSMVISLTEGLDFSIPLDGKEVSCGIFPITGEVFRIFLDDTKSVGLVEPTILEIDRGNVRTVQGKDLHPSETEALFDAIVPFVRGASRSAKGYKTVS